MAPAEREQPSTKKVCERTGLTMYLTLRRFATTLFGTVLCGHGDVVARPVSFLPPPLGLTGRRALSTLAA